MPDQISTSRALGVDDPSFRRALDTLPSPVWMAALDASGVWFNRAWLQFVGTTLDHALATPWTTWAHPDDYTAIAAAFGPAVERQESFDVEARMRRYDGHWRCVKCHGAPLRDAEGRAVAFLGALTDITEMRDSLDRMTLVLDHIGAPAFLHTVEGRYLFVNEEWHRQFNPERRTVVGRNVSEFLPEEQVREILRTNAITASTGKRYEYEVALTTLDGPRSFLVKKFALPDATGALSIVCGVATELTEVRKREQHTRDLEAQLLEARHMESIGVLAGGIAHDFNNLMQAVLGNASLAAADMPEDAPSQAWIAEIVHSATRAADLTRQLLDFAGRPSLHAEEIDVLALLRRWEPALRAAIPAGAVLELHLPGALPAVLADSPRLQQLLGYFVSNAVEALDRRPGTLALRAGFQRGAEDPGAHKFADAPPSGERVFVEIADDGPGMDEDTAARVFEPFFTTRFAGRGLGLSAALGIARAHGGTIGLVTAPGKGASFRVLLPVAQPSRSASRNASP